MNPDIEKKIEDASIEYSKRMRINMGPHMHGSQGGFKTGARFGMSLCVEVLNNAHGLANKYWAEWLQSQIEGGK